MATIRCMARVRKDGMLSISKAGREALELQPGEEVELVLEKQEPIDTTKNPLYGIIGIAKGGPPDGAENHDKYLYGKKSS